jgi:DNA gyrase/topoisomerase IV subunit A
LLIPRERKTITFLSQSGILKDFSIEALGVLAQTENSFSLISSDDSALSAIKEECRRRLKSEELPLIHYWLLQFPNLRNWLTDNLILQRLRPQHDYLSQLVFDEGRVSGEHHAQEATAIEIEKFKNEIKVVSASETRLTAELSSLDTRYKELEQRLRNVANSANSSRDDQLRQAQIDSVKVLIEFMNVVEISSSIDEGITSTLNATRAKLKHFGVTWRYDVGAVVPFVAQDHLASNLAEGAMVRILTPCYYMANTPSQIALVKARVLPQ